MGKSDMTSIASTILA